MPHPPRHDYRESWHHVMNRGIARRTVFELPRDGRRFLAGLARAVRRGDVRVHAYSLLSTHYHLLVSSPAGRLSEGIGRAQNEYVRYFNRDRRRDGPLFRGRFTSKLVKTAAYRHTLVRYIDHNPVLAGLAAAPAEHP